jgi:two-component system OmpR family sensor kinase
VPGGPRDSDAAGEIAGSALRSSRRMRHLVGDLLLLARADAGRWDPRRPVDLAVIVREAVTEAAPLGSGHPISLDLPHDGAPLVVEGTTDDLHRLVLNLIENALIHTPAGTPVVASAERVDGTIRLQVADRGPGVPPELRGRIFERFARTLESDGERPEGSSGLGLAIVRAVAEAHGGAVEVSDAEGGGALFTVTLPAAAIRSPSDGVVTRDRPPVTDPKGADIA